MDRGWKQYERRSSRDMGVERQPVTGERNGADNAPHPRFCFQFKLRRLIPTWLFTWLAGITSTASRDGKVGVLVLKRPRMEDGDAVVVLRWRDWVDLHGPAPYGSLPHRSAELSSGAMAWSAAIVGSRSRR
jgi:hypothetical protein